MDEVKRVLVSTHASAREATFVPPVGRTSPRSFYPRLREGGDSYRSLRTEKLQTFLPTPPRGRRLPGKRPR